jgi:hypothetical protein
MTIGLTWRRTARRIKRLKEGVLTISPDYSDRPTPDFLALSNEARDNALREPKWRSNASAMDNPQSRIMRSQGGNRARGGGFIAFCLA